MTKKEVREIEDSVDQPSKKTQNNEKQPKERSLKSKKDLTWTEQEADAFMQKSKGMKVEELDLPKAVVKDLKAAGYKLVTEIIEAGPDKLAQSLLIDPEEILMISKSIKNLISSD